MEDWDVEGSLIIIKFVLKGKDMSVQTVFNCAAYGAAAWCLDPVRNLISRRFS
jgi:hypothetical protein